MGPAHAPSLSHRADLLEDRDEAPTTFEFLECVVGRRDVVVTTLPTHFDFLPPLRLADLPALAIRAARDFDMPLRFSALYFFLFFTEDPAMSASLLRI
jgi:hypothetical protein